MTSECSGRPRSVWLISVSVVMTICSLSVPILAKPTQFVSAVRPVDVHINLKNIVISVPFKGCPSFSLLFIISTS